jgi:hypothetical protein
VGDGALDSSSASGGRVPVPPILSSMNFRIEFVKAMKTEIRKREPKRKKSYVEKKAVYSRQRR